MGIQQLDPYTSLHRLSSDHDVSDELSFDIIMLFLYNINEGAHYSVRLPARREAEMRPVDAHRITGCGLERRIFIRNHPADFDMYRARTGGFHADGGK